MNYRMILKIVGRVVGIEAAFMLIPTVISLYCHESVKGFLAALAIALGFFALSALVTKNHESKFYAKEGFASVGFSWVAISLIGAVPFVVEGVFPTYVDAIFETVSGFTTTGSTLLSAISILPRGILFWRSLTHWIGGMGLLVFMMAVVPMSEEYSMYIMRAEVPGLDAGKLTARIQHNSLVLYLIYIFLTVAETVLLKICGLSFYDSLVHAISTAGTGGFSVYDDSIASCTPAVQVTISIFMMLFGINFNLYFFLLLKKFKPVIKSEELRCYLGIIAFSTITIALNIRKLCGGSFATALRLAFFQVNSFASTTGFSSTDFDKWPTYSKMLMLILMLVGSCAGSTAGGIKVSRIAILCKASIAEIKHMLHPRSINPVRLEGKTVSKEILRGTTVYFSIVIIFVAVGSLLVSLEGYDMVTSISSVATCISNVGPGFSMVGPTCNFAIYSAPTKLLLSVFMLMGRLELFPIIILFYPSTWKKRGQF